MKMDKYIMILLLLATVVGLSLFVPPFYAACLIPAVTLAVGLIDNPRRFIFVYLIVMSSYTLIQLIVPITPVRYLNELMVLALLVIFIGQMAFRKLDWSIVRKNKFGFGALVGFAVLSWLINRGSIMATVEGMLLYFSFIPFYVLSVNFLTRRDLKVLIFGAVGFFWVNFVLNIGWFLGFNPLPNRSLEFAEYGSGVLDASKGVFGSQSIMAYFCIMLFFILFSFSYNKNTIITKKHKIIINITLASILVQLGLTFTNHAYIYFVLAMVPFALVSKMWRQWLAPITMVLLVTAFFIAYSKSDVYKRNFGNDVLIWRYEKFVSGPKVLLLKKVVVENLHDSPMVWLLGVGPGNGMGSVGKQYVTPFAYEMLGAYYASMGQLSKQGYAMTSITGSTQSSILTLWGDFGIIGFLLYLWIYIRLLIILVHRALRARGDVQCLAIGMIGVLAMYTLTGLTYDMQMVVQLLNFVWIFAAIFAVVDDDDTRSVESGEAEKAVSP